MKLEHDASTPTPTQAPAYTTTQWTTGTGAASSSSQVPIDPVLQQQSQQQQQLQQQQQPPTTQTTQQAPVISYPHYQPYTQTTHYTQTSYGAHTLYQQYQALQQAHQPAPVARQPTQQSNEVDTTDVATLNDALGSAGVDLRAEEETLQRSHDHHQSYRPQEDRTRRQSPSVAFDPRVIGATMREIGTRHKVSKIPEDSVNYLALALRARLQDLMKAMIQAAEHRTEAQFDRPPGLYEDGTPMWSVTVRRDARKQLEALEKVEREYEMKVRRERKERAEALAAQAAAMAAAQAAGGAGAPQDGMMVGMDDPMDGSGAKRPKKKKDGPGVTAKNMSEDVQKRLSNAVATQAAGLGRGKYAWMNAGNVPAAPKPKPAAAAATTTPAPGTAATTTTPQMQPQQGTWAKPYVPTTVKTTGASPGVEEDTRRTVTMRDALFVVSRERGHGGGRGAARGWV